jgi:hypothetical protein
MKIALLTCEKLPDLTIQDRPLIAELAKSGIIATAAFGMMQASTGVILIIWFFAIPGIISKKEMSSTFGLIK